VAEHSKGKGKAAGDVQAGGRRAFRAKAGGLHVAVLYSLETPRLVQAVSAVGADKSSRAVMV
jgi:hypothetical protein